MVTIPRIASYLGSSSTFLQGRSLGTAQQETFEVKNFLEFRIFHQSAKVFSLESFPLYGMRLMNRSRSQEQFEAQYNTNCQLAITALEGFLSSSYCLIQYKAIWLELQHSIATVNHIMVSSYNLTGVQPRTSREKYSTLSCMLLYTGLDQWTGLVDWTGGLTLQIIFMLLMKLTYLHVGLHDASY